MKMNLNLNRGCSGNVLLITFGLAGAVAIGALSLGVWADDAEGQRELARVEREATTMAKLSEMARINGLIREIGNGGVDGVKQGLSLELAEDLAEFRSSLGSVDGEARDFAENACDIILQAEKAHPEYYLTSSPTAQFYEKKAWEAAAAEPVKPIKSFASPDGRPTAVETVINN